MLAEQDLCDYCENSKRLIRIRHSVHCLCLFRTPFFFKLPSLCWFFARLTITDELCSRNNKAEKCVLKHLIRGDKWCWIKILLFPQFQHLAKLSNDFNRCWMKCLCACAFLLKLESHRKKIHCCSRTFDQGASTITQKISEFIWIICSAFSYSGFQEDNNHHNEFTLHSQTISFYQSAVVKMILLFFFYFQKFSESTMNLTDFFHSCRWLNVWLTPCMLPILHRPLSIQKC